MSRLSAGVILAAAVLVLAACELNGTEAPPTGPVAPDPVREAPSESAAERPVAPPVEPAPQSEVTDPADAPGSNADAPGSDPSDRAITEQVRQALAADEWLSWAAREIDVSTHEGVVTLRGRVESEDERYIVMDIAWDIEGVRDVIDELEVRGDGL